MGTRLLVMQCSERGLGYLSLVFGLLAVGTLSLSVATDFWLFTSEGLKLSPPEDAPPGAASYEAAYDELNMTEIDEVDGEMAMDYSLPLDGTVQVNVHSGLWRLCMYSDDQDGKDRRPQCMNIGYFGQDSERPNYADTTFSILRAIRKSSPVIVGSLVVMVTALTFAILGSTKHDVKTLIAAILYISGALSLAVGVIFYISAVNDEVSHSKKAPSSSKAGDFFSYRYGWAFFFAGASFMCSMAAAVNNISLYLRRGVESHDTDEELTMVMGRADATCGEKQPAVWRQQHHQTNITTPV